MQIHLSFVAMLPCRVVDTRTGNGFTGAFGPPSLLGGVSRTFPIQSSSTCTIPTEAQAYSFDITVVPPGPLTYVTAYPTGQPTPVAAIAVESPLGTLASGTGIIPAGSNGSIDIYASNPTELVVDINGYYVSFAFAFPNLYAMENLPAGNSNPAMGVKALMNVSNTACGYLALVTNTTGSNNMHSEVLDPGMTTRPFAAERRIRTRLTRLHASQRVFAVSPRETTTPFPS